jgi:hypothetical protein
MLNSVAGCCGVGVVESVAITTKPEVPSAVGVPEIVPLLLSERPAGRVPPRLHVTGGVPPLDCRVWE